MQDQGKKPTHIVIFSTFFDPYMSGAEQCVLQLAERLGGKGEFSFTIITGLFDRALPRYENRGKYVILRVGIGNKIDKFLYTILAPLRALIIDPQIVHAIMESYAGVALAILKLLKPRTRALLTLQSGNLDDKAQSLKIPNWLWKWIHTSPDISTGISSFLCERAQKLGAKSVTKIPNGIDGAFLKQIADSTLEKKSNVIGCVARLSNEKGVEELLTAFAIVHKAIPESILMIVGDGVLRESLQKQSRELGIAQCVEWCGRLSHRDAMKILAEVRIAVVPSRAEGLGIAALEAFGLGLPVVATAVGGLKEIVMDKKNGLLVESMNLSALADAMICLMTDEKLYEVCVDGARHTAKQFEWEMCMRSYEEVYRLILLPRFVIAAGIYSPDSGGPATYVLSIEEAMRQQGIRYETITYADDMTSVPNVTKISRAENVLMRYARYTLALWKLARRADIVYLQDSFSAGVPLRFIRMFTYFPFILKIVGDPAWERSQAGGKTTDTIDEFQLRTYDMHTEIIRHLSRWVAKSASKIIVPSFYLSRIVSGWGIDPKSIEVIYNATETPSEMKPIDSWPHRRVILTVGRLVPWKGIDQLIRVIGELPPDVDVVVIGDGPERRYLEALAEEKAVVSRVHFLGTRDHCEVAWAMQKADVFALCSTYEGLSHVLIEAQHLGLPTVATNVGGNSEVITHKKNGLLVSPSDTIMLGKSLNLILEDSEVSGLMRENALKNATRFSKREMVEKTIEILLQAYAHSTH